MPENKVNSKDPVKDADKHGLPEDTSFDPKGQPQNEVQDEIADLMDIKGEEGDEEPSPFEEGKSSKGERIDANEVGEKETLKKEKDLPEKKEEGKKKEGDEGKEEPGEPSEEDDKDPLKDDTVFQEMRKVAGMLGEDKPGDILSDTEEGTPSEEEKEKEGKEETKKVKDDTTFNKFVEDVLSSPIEKEVEVFRAEDYEEFTDETVQKMNKTINALRQNMMKELRKIALRDGMQVFPKVLEGRTKALIAAGSFWDTNKDIKKMCSVYPEFKTYIGRAAQDLKNKNPKWSIDKIFNETAKEVRTVLGDRLKHFQEKGEVADSGGNGKTKPAFARKPSRTAKRTTDNSALDKDDQRQQIKELLDFSADYGY